MRKKDIEKILINSADSFVPNCLDKVLEKTKFITPVENNIVIKPALSFFRRFAIALSCVLVLMIAGVGGYFGYMNQDYQTIYMDINPSMAVTIDHFEKVKEVVYLNDDSEKLFSDFKPEGKSIDEVMQQFIDECNEKGIFATNSTLYISLYGKNQSKAQEALDKLNNRANQILNEKKIESKVEKNKINKEEKKNAENQKISPAKLRLINMIINQTQEYSEEKLKEMTMHELKTIVDELLDKILEEEIINNGGGRPNPNPNPDDLEDDENSEDYSQLERSTLISMIMMQTKDYNRNQLLNMDLNELKEILYELYKEQSGKGNYQGRKNG